MACPFHWSQTTSSNHFFQAQQKAAKIPSNQKNTPTTKKCGKKNWFAKIFWEVSDLGKAFRKKFRKYYPKTTNAKKKRGKKKRSQNLDINHYTPRKLTFCTQKRKGLVQLFFSFSKISRKRFRNTIVLAAHRQGYRVSQPFPI